MSMGLLDELLVGLGFEYDPKEMRQFKDDVGRTTSIIKSMAKVAVAGAAAITTMTVASARASDEQGKLAEEIGETVNKVNAFQFANQLAGGTADGMSNSLKTLTSRAAEAARGVGSGVEAFGLLGISATDAQGRIKGASELMTEISAQFQGMERGRQIELAEKLGLTDSLRLLQLGPQRVAELTQELDELGSTTAEDAAMSAEFNRSLIRMWAVVKDVTRALSREFMPILRENVDLFVQWWKTNGDLIKQNLPEWIEQLTKGFKLFVVAVGAFLAYRLAMHLVTLIGLMKGLTAATMAANVAFFLLPAVLTALALAFVAVMQDAKVFFDGGESFIGDMIDKYPQWERQLSGVAAVMATIWDVTAMIWEGWKGIIDLMSKFSVENAKEVGGNIPGFLADLTGLQRVDGTGLIPEVSESINNARSTFVDRLDIIIQGGTSSAQEIADRVYDVFQQTSQDLNSTVDQ